MTAQVGYRRSVLCHCFTIFLLAAALRANGQESTESAKADLPPIPKRSPVGREALPAPFRKVIPTTVDDLQSFEKYMKRLAAKVSPSVVAVQVGGATGSGVVVSEDGLVLTAAHVSSAPNRNVTFIFPDGKKVTGKTLGTNHGIDAGVMKITDQGPWPHVEIGDLDQARLGDWVLALGHPGGFDPDRSTVVRLGRIIRLGSSFLQTDCTIISGDSGGPLFDMHGQVIGIHSRISDSTAANFHVPIRTYYDTWERLVQGENWDDSGRPWLGVWGLDHAEGFRVELVNQRGPAEKAGLQIGDTILKFNGRSIGNFESFKKAVGKTKVADRVKVVFKRDGMEMSAEIKVEARPSWLGE
ncbi:MAG: PDZ domain-containing protein [Verrucomicrobia bacterium]|nr:PDZ domain-containing protein [Verrucomicrobiota bacterium]